MISAPGARRRRRSPAVCGAHVTHESAVLLNRSSLSKRWGSIRVSVLRTFANFTSLFGVGLRDISMDDFTSAIAWSASGSGGVFGLLFQFSGYASISVLSNSAFFEAACCSRRSCSFTRLLFVRRAHACLDRIMAGCRDEGKQVARTAEPILTGWSDCG